MIAFLFKDDRKPTDWGVVFARLLDAGLQYDEIAERTVPQIEAILGEWSKIRVYMPNLFGGMSSPPVAPQPPSDGKPPKVSQFAALANMFSGIK